MHEAAQIILQRLQMLRLPRHIDSHEQSSSKHETLFAMREAAGNWSSNLTKCCACHKKLQLSWSKRNLAENGWNVIYNVRPIRAWSGHEKCTHATRLATERAVRTRQKQFLFKNDNTSCSGYHSKFHQMLHLPWQLTHEHHQMLHLPQKSDTWTSPNAAPATKSDASTSPKAAFATKSGTWTSPNVAPATKSNTWTSPNAAPATKTDEYYH